MGAEQQMNMWRRSSLELILHIQKKTSGSETVMSVLGCTTLKEDRESRELGQHLVGVSGKPAHRLRTMEGKGGRGEEAWILT